MMKKILAAAIVSAFAAPAFAATANVDIYGTLSVSIDSLNDGTNRGNNVSSNASNIGFKGSEDMGGGLKAVWQFENILSLDGPVAGNSANSVFGGMRDSFAGLSGNFGTLRIGYFDTPMKQVSRKLDLFNNKIGDTRNLMTGSSSNWEARFNNGIRYDSPDFAGFSGSVHYSTQYGAAGTAPLSGAGVAAAVTSNNKDAYALGLNYKTGPIVLMAAYQTAEALTNTNDEKAWRLGAGVNLGDITVNALYHAASDMGGVVNADRKVYGLGGAYKMGNASFSAQYYRATDLDSNGALNDSAKMFAIGADYSLSKRTSTYVAYAKTTNSANGTFSMAGGGHGDNFNAVGSGGSGALVGGKDPSGFSLGMVHKF